MRDVSNGTEVYRVTGLNYCDSCSGNACFSAYKFPMKSGTKTCAIKPRRKKIPLSSRLNANQWIGFCSLLQCRYRPLADCKCVWSATVHPSEVVDNRAWNKESPGLSNSSYELHVGTSYQLAMTTVFTRRLGHEPGLAAVCHRLTRKISNRH